MGYGLLKANWTKQNHWRPHAYEATNNVLTLDSSLLFEKFAPVKQRLTLMRKMIFMYDNAPSHAACYSCDALSKFGLRDCRVILWQACSPDLNPIENFWSQLRRKVYEGGNFHQKGSLGNNSNQCSIHK